MGIKQLQDKRETEMYGIFVELYAITEATEELEKAYVRDIIFSSSGYATDCLKLVVHFETFISTRKGTIPTICCFACTYEMDCPYARNHLLTSAIVASAAPSAFTAVVAECVLNFITATMVPLKLNMVVEQVHPSLYDLSAPLNKLGTLPPVFKRKTKMKERISRLLNMEATDELGYSMAWNLTIIHPR